MYSASLHRGFACHGMSQRAKLLHPANSQHSARRAPQLTNYNAYIRPGRGEVRSGASITRLLGGNWPTGGAVP